MSALAAAATTLVWGSPLGADGAHQLEMARSFAGTGVFRVEGEFSRFYPPVYPLVLTVPGLFLGFTPGMVHLVQTLTMGILVFSTYLVGSAFGRRVGLIAAFLVAINPIFLGEVGEGRATLLSALLLLWLFHFVRLGIADDRHLGWAGLLAGLLYLTKDTTGYVAILGISVGVIWRVRYAGWRAVVTSRHYALGGAVFAAFYLGWAMRNVVRFGSPISNPGVLTYANTFFLSTVPGEGILLVGGAALIFVIHWVAWIWPSLIDPRTWIPVRTRFGSLRKDQPKLGLIVFLGTTLFLSSLMTAIFIRGLGNYVFPEAVSFSFRLLAAADPLLMIGVGILVTFLWARSGWARREGLVALVKVVAVASLLLAPWPATVGQAAATASVYTDLGGFLENNPPPYYSEASTLLSANLPGLQWEHVDLDFSGLTLDHRAAGVPEGATIVTIGRVATADFVSGPYSVILNVDWSNPPEVLNPFFTP